MDCARRRHARFGRSAPRTGVPLLEGPAAEFSTEAEARDYALRAAEAWIDENLLPRSPDRDNEQRG